MNEQSQSTKMKLSTLDILGIVLIVLFLPIIIINFILVIKGAVNPDKVPMVFNTAPLIVISDSMTIDEDANSGAFNKGDLIFVHRINPDELDVDDIITYISKEGDVITHRITDVFEEDGVRSFETKGDASPGYDYYAVHYDQIVGVYKGTRLPRLGDVAMFFQTPGGVICVLGIPLVAVLSFDIVKKQKQNKQSQARTDELEAELRRLKEAQEKKEEE